MSRLLDALAGVLNAREPLPGLVTGGQPGVEHLAALKRAGCDVVIDMRDPMEPQPFDAPQAVRAAGLEYVNLTVPHTVPEDRTFDEVRRSVTDLAARGRSAFAYCNSGNRVGAVLIPHFVLDLGLEADEAVTRAMQMGTRSAELVEGALDYVRRREGERDERGARGKQDGTSGGGQS
jgi:protein tyrosine phosphatase (PTP) superfamily phosphohydrolase (DUF442 family)